MELTANPGALDDMEEDVSEGEDEEDEEGDDDEDEDDETIDEEIDEEDEIYDDHHNDTTEEADEDDYGENAAEETAYTTTQAFTSKMLNESFISNKSVTFAENTTTIAGSSAETFCLSQKPCSLQMFDSLVETDKLQAFKSIIEVSYCYILKYD